MVTITLTLVACHAGTGSTIPGSTTASTVLTAGTALGMTHGTEDGMAAGMILGITAMLVGTAHTIMATMAGAGLIAMVGMVGTLLTGVVAPL